MHARFALLLPLVLLRSSQDPPAPRPPETDAPARRERALEIARAYAMHPWTAGPQHVLHGADPDGVRVDTPDADHVEGGFAVDGTPCLGIPYQWGGFSSLAEFDAGLREGRYAGHVPREESEPASAWAVGVDCSGFVSRCWELPVKQSTRSLGGLCRELEGYGELAPGDLLLSFDGHAMLFAGFENESRERVHVFEAAVPLVRETVHAVADLERAGLRPLRYERFDSKWKVLELGPPSFTSSGEPGRFEAAGAGAHLPFRCTFWDAKVGQWARYEERGRNSPSPVLRRAISRLTGTAIEVQTALELDGQALESSDRRPWGERLDELLLAFPPGGEKPHVQEIDVQKYEAGHFLLGGRSFRSWRVEALVLGLLTVRGQRLSIRVEIEMIGSPEVPVDSVLRARYRYSYGDTGVPGGELTYELVAFGEP